jgi:regulator of RNase E activity RraA
MSDSPIHPAVLVELGRASTPSVLNGLKRLGVPVADLQTMDRYAVRAISPELGPRVGFAATRTVRTERGGTPPDERRAAEMAEVGEAQLRRLPEPRILVVDNVGDWRGPVCIWGDVAATINLASGVVAGITNGPVRDVPEMTALGFATWAAGPDVGGGHVELVAVGEPVVVGGVPVQDGDLLHADLHGVARIPLEVAADLPAAIRAHAELEQRVVEVTRSPGFTVESIRRAWRS